MDGLGAGKSDGQRIPQFRSSVGVLALALFLAACGANPDSTPTSTSVPEVATTTSVSPSTVPVEVTTSIAAQNVPELVLGPEGLSATLTFGSDGDDVVTAIKGLLGEPARDHIEEFQLLTEPVGDNVWGDAPDGLGLISEHPYFRSVCWDTGLCIEMDSDDGETWTFEVWSYQAPADGSDRLSTAQGITVGSTFEELRSAYPELIVNWGEGPSTGFSLPGWMSSGPHAIAGNGTFDITVSQIPGFDYDELLPEHIPDSAAITSMTAGEGVDLGCC